MGRASRADARPDREGAAAGRREDAAAFARHLLVEAQEIHDLYSEWVAALPGILEREGFEVDVPGVDKEAEWRQFGAAAEELAVRCERGDRPSTRSTSSPICGVPPMIVISSSSLAGWTLRPSGSGRSGWARSGPSCRPPVSRRTHATTRAQPVGALARAASADRHRGDARPPWRPRTPRDGRGPRARGPRRAALLPVRVGWRAPPTRGVRRDPGSSRLRVERARRVPLLHPLLRAPAADADRPARLPGAGHRPSIAAR